MDELEQNVQNRGRSQGVNALKRRFSASLSLKLLGIFFGGSLVLMLLLGALFRFGLDRQSLNAAAPLLNHYLHYLIKEVGDPPDVARAKVVTARWPITIRIFDQRRDISWASDGRIHQPRLKEWRHKGDNNRPLAGRIYWDHGTAMLKRQIGGANVYFGLRFRPAGPPWFLLVFAGLVLLAIFGFYWFTRRLFAPIRQIESGIGRIGDGELSHRIELDRSDELGSLAGRVNQMAEQLESMMQARRDLLLAISHELKSPLARSRVSLALIEDSEYYQPLLDDHREMQALIDGIIEAERTQGNFALLQRQPTDINELVRRVLARFDVGDSITCYFEPELIEANVDPMQIERLLRNLLENALRYNDAKQGPVQLICGLGENELCLQVIDHGPGIEAQHLDRLTEAFYRADPSRVRKSGGLGLGLYLCQVVVEAHHGSMSISSKPGQGARVSCRISLF